MKKIRDGYENNHVRVVTKSGAIIEGCLNMGQKTDLMPQNHFLSLLDSVPFFKLATIEVHGNKRECYSVVVEVENIEIIALLHPSD